MQQLIEKLQKLKGLLLLDKNGEVYIVRSFDVLKEIITTKSWFKTKIEEVEYVSNIRISNDSWDIPCSKEQHLAINITNRMIDDRKRFVMLQKSLKNIGATITTKKF